MHSGEYHVRYIDSAMLPEGQEWAFIEWRGETWLVMYDEHTEEELEQMWAAYRELAETA